MKIRSDCASRWSQVYPGVCLKLSTEPNPIKLASPNHRAGQLDSSIITFFFRELDYILPPHNEETMLLTSFHTIIQPNMVKLQLLFLTKKCIKVDHDVSPPKVCGLGIE
jgi:hypothetical protein